MERRGDTRALLLLLYIHMLVMSELRRLVTTTNQLQEQLQEAVRCLDHSGGIMWLATMFA